MNFDYGENHDETTKQNTRKILIYRVSMSLSGLSTSLFIYFTFFLASVQARTEVQYNK